MNNTQPLLFDIPSIAETGCWCNLNEGIDPGQWARTCRKIGELSPDQFAEVNNLLEKGGKTRRQKLFTSPDSLFFRLKRVFCFKQDDFAHLPLVSIGPERVK